MIPNHTAPKGLLWYKMELMFEPYFGTCIDGTSFNGLPNIRPGIY